MSEKKSYFDEMPMMTEDDAAISMEAEPDETTTSRIGATALRWAVTVLVFAAFAAAAWFLSSPVVAVAGLVAAGLLFSCMHVVLEWERSVVLRFGKFNRVAGPGLIFMIPLVEYAAATVDMRMRSTAFKAEHVLTADLVPVNVDAVLFWTVWDAGKACSEVKNFVRLVYWVAQTTLRDVMGAVNIAQLSTRREQIDREVADILERKTNEWGITVVSVEIRDIEIPDDLQEALSAEARAEREYNARVILAEVEKEISEMFVDAARTYGREDAALQLRAMSFVSDSVKEKGGLVVVPSALSEAFEGLEKLAKG
ncbi:slipin family protein [Arabiibacter massiliensis]|uniref:slipin family protein n=1 Tax=Arabiibacter massiliensis TaxID=1870985 RepID=UPI0009B94806|nr:slipin family protein [Arabiibacter massiliensis]